MSVTRLPFLTALVFALASFAIATADDHKLLCGLDLTLEGAAGLSGGARRGEALHALALGHIAWQAPEPADDRLHFHSYASVLSLRGDGPSERFLGDYLAASNIEGFESTRLYACWVEAHCGAWSLRAGTLLADEEFAGSEVGGIFLNSAFGWPAFISANTVNTGPAFYVAAPGLRLEHLVVPGLTWRIGLYDGDTFDSASGDPAVNRHGLHYQLGGEQGWFIVTELAYAPEGRPTRLKAGAWHHTAMFADQYFDEAGQPFALSGQAPREHPGNSGGYLALEHTLVGESGKPDYVEFFARLGTAPGDRSTLTAVLDTGIAWTGPLSARPVDVLALGFVHAQFGRHLAHTAHLLDPTGAPVDAEQVIEASYTFPLNDHFSCKADAQYIRQPGGSRAYGDATLVMLRMLVSY